MQEVSRAYVLRYYKIYKKQQSAKNCSSLAKGQEILKMCEKAFLALISEFQQFKLIFRWLHRSSGNKCYFNISREARELHRGS